MATYSAAIFHTSPYSRSDSLPVTVFALRMPSYLSTNHSAGFGPLCATLKTRPAAFGRRARPTPSAEAESRSRFPSRSAIRSVSLSLWMCTERLRSAALRHAALPRAPPRGRHEICVGAQAVPCSALLAEWRPPRPAGLEPGRTARSQRISAPSKYNASVQQGSTSSWTPVTHGTYTFELLGPQRR